MKKTCFYSGPYSEKFLCILRIVNWKYAKSNIAHKRIAFNKLKKLSMKQLFDIDNNEIVPLEIAKFEKRQQQCNKEDIEPLEIELSAEELGMIDTDFK